MRDITASALKLAVSFCVIVGSTAASLSANAAAEDNWSFDVFLDDKRIGEHNFVVKRKSDSKIITTSADFDVKFLFVTAFSYEHDNTETWKDGCLTQIEATTKVNGNLSVVEGRQLDDTFSIRANEEKKTFDGCVSTFAYWNQDFLTASELLNSQTGELEPVSVANLGESRFQLNNQTVEATRYQLTVDDTPIDLWYSSDGRWLGLQTLAKGDRVLRYQATELPLEASNTTGD